LEKVKGQQKNGSWGTSKKNSKKAPERGGGISLTKTLKKKKKPRATYEAGYDSAKKKTAN